MFPMGGKIGGWKKVREIGVLGLTGNFFLVECPPFFGPERVLDP
jgi:hypothetical protein